jgi:hypothetical protein
MTSPYKNVPVEGWNGVTKELLKKHPLNLETIREAAQAAWSEVWSTQIGQGKIKVLLRDIAPPATVIGYFFEKLLARELAERFPERWRGGVGSEKDLHFVPDETKSIEVKASGQLGLKIFGNRSYGQELENAGLAKKDKSGYYITVNFFGDKLTLVRFGWIDAGDWQAQKAATGQMAGLGADVYKHKLVIVPGDYLLDAPVSLIDGVGGKTLGELKNLGIATIRQLISYGGKLDARLEKAKANAIKFAVECGALEL